MKRIILFLACLMNFALPFLVRAQVPATFTVASDVVTVTVLKTLSPADNITNITGNNLALSWHVTACDFPVDWLTVAAFGICDDVNCRNNSGGSLWNETTGSGNTFTSIYYTNGAVLHDSVGGFSLSLDLASATTMGTHSVTINIRDTVSGYNKNVTFTISKLVNTVAVPAVPVGGGDVILYPNPANDDVNVIYDAASDVRNIAVYNIIGNVLTVYKVSGSSANLDLSNFQSGIYFVRLYDGEGRVVATKKFTKQ